MQKGWMALIALVACAPSATVVAPKLAIPGQYATGGSADGTRVADISWREYMGDKHLVALIDMAIAGNLDLAMAISRVELARAAFTATSGLRFPHVDAFAGAGVTRAGEYTAEGAGNRSTDITAGRRVPTILPNFEVALQASWEIDLWGRLKNQRSARLAEFLASVEGSRLAFTSLIAEVAMAYYELVANDEAIAVLTDAEQRSSQALEVVRLQKETARTTQLAVSQFEAELARVRALLIVAKQRVRLAETSIATLLGRFPAPVARSTASLTQPSPIRVRLGVPAELVELRPDIREATARLSATKFDAEAARAAFFPGVRLSAALGLTAFQPNLLFSPKSLAFAAGGGILAPLLNRAGLRGQLDAAKALQLQAIYHYQKTVIAAFVEVVDHVAAIEAAADLIEVVSQENAALNQAAAAAGELFKAGKATYLDILVAEQLALRARLEAIEVYKQRRLREISLYRALGGGWQAAQQSTAADRRG